MYIRDYDSTYFPAFPVAEIGINRVEDRPANEIVLTALVDSGSDGTIIPFEHLEAIGAEYVNSGFMRALQAYATQ